MRTVLTVALLALTACGGKETEPDGDCPDTELLTVENEGCTCGDLTFDVYEEDVGCACTDGELLCTDDQEEEAAN